jgi:hypothetical protein
MWLTKLRTLLLSFTSRRLIDFVLILVNHRSLPFSERVTFLSIGRAAICFVTLRVATFHILVVSPLFGLAHALVCLFSSTPLNHVIAPRLRASILR